MSSHKIAFDEFDKLKILIMGSSITARIRKETMRNVTKIHSYRGSCTEENWKF